MYSLFCKTCGLEIGGNDKIFRKLSPKLKCLKCGDTIDNPQGTLRNPKKELFIRNSIIVAVTVVIIAIAIFYII